MASAVFVRNGESLELPQIPNPSSTINQEQLEELLTALGPTLRIAVVTTLVLFVVQTISSGMFTHIIGNAIIGKKINAAESWAKTKPQLGRIIVVSLISFLFPILAIIAGSSIGVALTGISNLFVFVGLGIGLVGAIYVWISLYVIVPTLVLEDTTLKGAIKRSFYLAKGNILRVFGIGIMGIITSQAISIVVSTPFALFAQTGADQDPTTSSVFMSTMGSVIGYTFMLPFVATFTTLLYTDLRIRKENLATDLNKAANQ
jgi:uncharacterized membrane protein